MKNYTTDSYSFYRNGNIPLSNQNFNQFPTYENPVTYETVTETNLNNNLAQSQINDFDIHEFLENNNSDNYTQSYNYNYIQNPVQQNFNNYGQTINEYNISKTNFKDSIINQNNINENYESVPVKILPTIILPTTILKPGEKFDLTEFSKNISIKENYNQNIYENNIERNFGNNLGINYESNFEKNIENNLGTNIETNLGANFKTNIENNIENNYSELNNINEIISTNEYYNQIPNYTTQEYKSNIYQTNNETQNFDYGFTTTEDNIITNNTLTIPSQSNLGEETKITFQSEVLQNNNNQIKSPVRYDDQDDYDITNTFLHKSPEVVYRMNILSPVQTPFKNYETQSYTEENILDISDIYRLKEENELYKEQLKDLDKYKSAAEETQSLKKQVEQLSPLKEHLTELETLKSQLSELNELKAKVAELEKLKIQLLNMDFVKKDENNEEIIEEINEEKKEEINKEINDEKKGEKNEVIKEEIKEEQKRRKKVIKKGKNMVKKRRKDPKKEKEIKNVDSNKTEEETDIINIEKNNTKIPEDKSEQTIVKGEIIHNMEELELIIRKINKSSTKITLNLLYKASADNDKASEFHKRCNKAKCTLVLIETDKGKRFGGYTTCSWKGKCLDKKDDEAFVFSLDKMKVYSVIPGENAIGCYPKFGPIFLGCQIRIYDNAFTKGGSTFKKGLNYNTEEDYELTGGDRLFNIKDIEVYEVIQQ